jgi:hypothetical protein
MTRTITNTVERTPVGPYPHDLLCGHVGKPPINKARRITKSIVPVEITIIVSPIY